MAAEAVEFADVSFELPGGRRLLSDVSIELTAGSTTALLGRSGSGKTTLLRMVNGLVRPTAGKVTVGHRTMVDGVTLRRGIGYVIQDTGLFPHMSIERNVGMALELAGKSHGEIAIRAGEMLDLVGLGDGFAERYPWQLSGGQRQRAGLARALAGEPSVLLMDEPFGALDPLTRVEMQTMLRDLLKRVGKTALLVTHDLEEALYLADRVILLEAGRIVADLPSAEVRSSENEAVQKYVAATHREPAGENASSPTDDNGAIMKRAAGNLHRDKTVVANG